MSAVKSGTGEVKSWRVNGIDGVECFRARAITHHYGRHSHQGYAIGVIENGIGGLDIQGARRYIPAGNIVVINPGQVHTGYPAGERPLTYRMFYINTTTLVNLLPDKTCLPCFDRLHIDNPELAQQLLLLHSALENSTDTSEQQTLFTKTLRAFTCTYGQTVTADGKPEPAAIKQIKNFLRQHHRQNISIEDLANLTHFSRAHLIRTFKQVVGIPPYTYLLQIRIERAKTLLAQGMPVAQVAYEVGFVDQSHLTHRFKNITGITPKQYAKGHYYTRKSR
jgi:AraC-like DNA-binding protein